MTSQTFVTDIITEVFLKDIENFISITKDIFIRNHLYNANLLNSYDKIIDYNKFCSIWFKLVISRFRFLLTSSIAKYGEQSQHMLKDAMHSMKTIVLPHKSLANIKYFILTKNLEYVRERNILLRENDLLEPLHKDAQEISYARYIVENKMLNVITDPITSPTAKMSHLKWLSFDIEDSIDYESGSECDDNGDYYKVKADDKNHILLGWLNLSRLRRKIYEYENEYATRYYSLMNCNPKYYPQYTMEEIAKQFSDIIDPSQIWNINMCSN